MLHTVSHCWDSSYSIFILRSSSSYPNVFDWHNRFLNLALFQWQLIMRYVTWKWERFLFSLVRPRPLFTRHLWWSRSSTKSTFATRPSSYLLPPLAAASRSTHFRCVNSFSALGLVAVQRMCDWTFGIAICWRRITHSQCTFINFRDNSHFSGSLGVCQRAGNCEAGCKCSPVLVPSNLSAGDWGLKYPELVLLNIALLTSDYAELEIFPFVSQSH